MINRYIKNRKGQSTTEYALIIALIVLSTIVVVRLFGDQIRDLFVKAGKALK